MSEKMRETQEWTKERETRERAERERETKRRNEREGESAIHDNEG